MSSGGLFDQHVLVVSCQVTINGQSGSKIDALVRRLVWLREHHPELKSLVRPCSQQVVVE